MNDPEHHDTMPPTADEGVARVLAAVDQLHKVSREFSDTISAAIEELRNTVNEQYKRLAATSDRNSKRLARIEAHLGLDALEEQ